MLKKHSPAIRLHFTRRVLRSLAEYFLSFTIDVSLIIGGHWWGKSKGTKNGLSRLKTAPLELEHPLLQLYTRLLSPAYLRVGGTEADRIRYGFSREAPQAFPDQSRVATAERSFILKKNLWKKLTEYCRNTGVQLVFTLAAGPESRDRHRAWQSHEAERLLSYTARKNLPIAAWEFGNEVNAFPFLWGLKHRVSARQYAQDFETFSSLCERLTPQALRVGPASAVWPWIGEPHALIPGFCRSSAAKKVDVLSYHYYPQQSRRGRFAVRRARPHTLLHARILNGARLPLRRVRQSAQNTEARGARIWITESGHALYGGEPGISNTFLSTLWWLDQLALYATEGVDAVFRQTLVGSDYGLLEENTWRPRPDYYASFLWKKLIRSPVYEPPQVTGGNLRAWALGGEQRIWLILINLQRQTYPLVDLGQPYLEKIVFTAPPQSPELLLINGQPALPRLLWDWDTPEVQRSWGLTHGPITWSNDLPQQVSLPPLSCTFLSVAP